MPRVTVAVVRSEGEQALKLVAVAAGADEASLVKRLADGETSAFATLLERHLAGITAIARRMLRDDAEAEDVAQEAFLRLWRSGASLHIGPSGVRPWLRRVVSNLCIDRLRGAGRQMVTDDVPEQVEEPDQLASLERGELSARVDNALKGLPERQRLALTLFHFEGLSQNEVAAEMGITDEAVESLLARARRALRTALKDEWTALNND